MFLILEFQLKYRKAGPAAAALFHLLPETRETCWAKHLSELQSQVQPPSLQPLSLVLSFICVRRSDFILQTRYQKDREDMSQSLFCLMAETLQSQFVRDMVESHSQVRTQLCLEVEVEVEAQ